MYVHCSIHIHLQIHPHVRTPMVPLTRDLPSWSPGPGCLSVSCGRSRARFFLSFFDRSTARCSLICASVNQQVLDVNLKSVWLLSQAAGRHMVPLRRGKIINFASLLTFQGGLTVPAYAAAKGAVGQLTKALSNEWSQHNVQVNGICPGYIATDMYVYS